MATHTVTARTPGVFYRSPTPDAEPYAPDEGAVDDGQVVGLIEVMKTYREVTAEAGGRIGRWLVDNEAEVTIGQELLELET